MTTDSVENMIFDPPALRAGALAAILSVRPFFVFMKIDAASGKLDTTVANRYKSTWLGHARAAKPRRLATRGTPSLGFLGKPAMTPTPWDSTKCGG
jgi:hypothetical protein